MAFGRKPGKMGAGMGIYGRDYMRDEPQGRQFSLRGQAVTIQLIIANVAVFAIWLFAFRNPSLWQFMQENFTVSATGVLREFRIHTLVTSVFSHSDPWHIVFNMLFLWFFGSDVEALYGKKDFLVLYFASGVIASLAHVALDLAMGTPDGRALGASGAIMGIVIVFACLYPNRRVYYWFVPITVRWLAVVFVVVDVAGVLGGGGDHVAHAAHLGGALTGFLFYKFDLRLFARFTGRERSPRFHLRDHSKSLDAADAARVDALLEKIARFGKDSLSDSERRFLEDASRRMRR
ncbi:MAG: rhomboid family intramembrane serine protease [Planctomycetes bacterium]|nr:rhomboid family intramembrane serine protease [Planctomycetota bacterium]